MIEAVKWNGFDAYSIANFMGISNVQHKDGNLFIETLEGTMTASKGDWIIKGVNGEFYPCKPDIFEKTYEPFKDEPGKDVGHD